MFRAHRACYLPVLTNWKQLKADVWSILARNWTETFYSERESTIHYTRCQWLLTVNGEYLLEVISTCRYRSAGIWIRDCRPINRRANHSTAPEFVCLLLDNNVQLIFFNTGKWNRIWWGLVGYGSSVASNWRHSRYNDPAGALQRNIGNGETSQSRSQPVADTQCCRHSWSHNGEIRDTNEWMNVLPQVHSTSPLTLCVCGIAPESWDCTFHWKHDFHMHALRRIFETRGDGTKGTKFQKCQAITRRSSSNSARMAEVWNLKSLKWFRSYLTIWGRTVLRPLLSNHANTRNYYTN